MTSLDQRSAMAICFNDKCSLAHTYKNQRVGRLRFERTQSWTDPAKTFKTFTAGGWRASVCKTNTRLLEFLL